MYETSPIILDPLSYHNAGKSSFRIDEVKDTLSSALNYLNFSKIKYDKVDSDSNRNIIYDLFHNIDIK